MKKCDVLLGIQIANGELAQAIQGITTMKKDLKKSDIDLNDKIGQEIELTMFRAEKLMYLAKEYFR